jgi:hypothetical protein
MRSRAAGASTKAGKLVGSEASANWLIIAWPL